MAQTENKTAKADASASIAESQPPIVAEIMPPKPSEKKRTYCKPDQTPLSKILIEWATLMVAAGGLYVFAGQWDASRKANVINTGNAYATNRPWVGETFAKIYKPEVNKSLIWHIEIKNFGGSPALKVHTRSEVFVVHGTPNSKDIDDLYAKIDTTPAVANLFTGQTSTQEGGTREKVSLDDSVKMLSRIYGLVLLTEITYTDVLGGPTHTTRICQRYLVDLDLSASCGYGDVAN